MAGVSIEAARTSASELFRSLLRKQDVDHFPFAMVNATNWCNLSCSHCFVYRTANPSEVTAKITDEPSDAVLLAELDRLIQRHRIKVMLWMGGEPLLKPDLLRAGTPRFVHNIVTTNGTLPLVPLTNTHYVVSLDGPPAINDAIRGAGTFARVLRTLERVPPGFPNSVQAQCVVTRRNQDSLAELVELLRQSCVEWMTFSFYVPHAKDTSADSWPSLLQRDAAVAQVQELKERYPEFVRNSSASLRLLQSDRAPAVTARCPAKRFLLPLYLGTEGFEQPFCCYGNDVDCTGCGAWVVFHFAAVLDQLDADR